MASGQAKTRIPSNGAHRSGLLSRLLTLPVIQGDCDLQLLAEQQTPPVVEYRYGGVQVCSRVPFLNRGRQKGMVIELLCRPEYWGPAGRDLFVATRVNWVGLRNDGYWPAAFIEPGQTIEIEVVLGIFGPRPAILSVLGLPRLPLLFYYKVMGRSGIQWRVAELSMALAGGKKMVACGWTADRDSHPHPDHHPG